MDVETRKPFACKSRGCAMSFTNEDHLTVHEKKHEMVLNLCLGNKSSNTAFPADQTPTPTRLIKNCEEVGLFDDLKHVNPFDETFRRAVESNSNANTPNSDSSNTKITLSENLLACENHSESLHTPQVFPNVESQADFKVEKKKLTLQTNFTDKHRRTNEKPIKILNNNNNNNNKRSLPKKTIGKIKKQKLITPKLLVQQQAIILPDNNKHIIVSKPIFIPNAINVQPSQIIMSSIPIISTSSLNKSRPLILPKPGNNIVTSSPPEITIKEKLKAVLSGSKLLRTNSSNSSTMPPNTTKVEETDFIKNNSKEKPSVRATKFVYDKDCMERRKAAASRYRRKVKREQIDLKKRNNELAQENSQLKNEVKQLKQLLLVHQNCEISRAIPLGLNVHLTAAPGFISSPAIPISTSGLQFFINMPKTNSIGSNTDEM